VVCLLVLPQINHFLPLMRSESLLQVCFSFIIIEVPLLKETFLPNVASQKNIDSISDLSPFSNRVETSSLSMEPFRFGIESSQSGICIL
jgi:hypothetical protein